MYNIYTYIDINSYVKTDLKDVYLVFVQHSDCCVNGTLYTLICIFTATSSFRPFYSCCYRTKLREQYLSGENHCDDIGVHCFCHCCALCQEYRELQNRGFDMSAGNINLSLYLCLCVRDK